jgi:calpain-7
MLIMESGTKTWRAFESRAQNAELTIATRSGGAALKATIETAELYMQALRLVDGPEDRRRIDAKCKELIKKAESLKSLRDDAHHGREEMPLLVPPVSPRKLTTRENIILLEGSKLNNFVFKPWDKEPADAEFRLNPGEEPFLDAPELPLSDIQLESFDGWKRPAEALSSVRFPDAAGDNGITMTMINISQVDLVQDLTSDCSVVASLCAGTSRVSRGHQKVRDIGVPNLCSNIDIFH